MLFSTATAAPMIKDAPKFYKDFVDLILNTKEVIKKEENNKSFMEKVEEMFNIKIDKDVV